MYFQYPHQPCDDSNYQPIIDPGYQPNAFDYRVAPGGFPGGVPGGGPGGFPGGFPGGPQPQGFGGDYGRPRLRCRWIYCCSPSSYSQYDYDY